MSSTLNTGVDRNGPDDPSGDLAEIRSLPESRPDVAIARASLQPLDEAASLPPPGFWSVPNAIAPLTRYLGPLLTVASPAWVGDPVPRMCALQKKLVEHSLSLAQGERQRCLAAITVVETAVRLRMRLQQMRMNEMELGFKTESGSES
jgi:hypothetical protein